MTKLFSRNTLAVLVLAFPIAALADVTGTPTLTAGTTLSLDNGLLSSSGSGDITWTGSSIKVANAATDVDLASIAAASSFSGQSGFNDIVSIGKSLISQFSGQFGSYLTTIPITPSVNDILVVKTNGSNYSAALVTAISGGSITLEFYTFTGSSGGGGGGVTPTINAVENNYGAIEPGQPSYGIAPASLFVIYGSGLSSAASSLQSSAAPGLPLTLDQTSISVTVNGVTTQPAIYYASPTQIDAVLPSTTPTGIGTITVTYNNLQSSPAQILVTKSAFGIDTLYGTGSGGIVATIGSSVIVPTASAAPGQAITIWGSGLGADTANDDRTFPMKQDNLNNATVYIGDVQATVTYAGRSQYPGVDQVNVIVPSVSGCGLSVVVVANGLSSNFGTLPVNAGGGVCSDPGSGINGSEIGTLGGQTTVRSGFLALFEDTAPASAAAARSGSMPEAQTFTTRYTADASFTSDTGYSYIGGSSFLSIGSCIVNASSTSTGGGTLTSNGLDAGTPIMLTGGGLSLPIPEFTLGGQTVVGDYLATLTNPLTGGTAYTFTGPGGKDVGKFTATITFPVPLTWTNESSISAVTESQGQLITWTGGASGTYVYISGNSSLSTDLAVSGSFICLAPVSAQQFTIPSYVLLALPTGTGSLGVANYANLSRFTATGLDFGYVFAGVSSSENVTYQ